MGWDGARYETFGRAELVSDPSFSCRFQHAMSCTDLCFLSSAMPIVQVDRALHVIKNRPTHARSRRQAPPAGPAERLERQDRTQEKVRCCEPGCGGPPSQQRKIARRCSAGPGAKFATTANASSSRTLSNNTALAASDATSGGDGMRQRRCSTAPPQPRNNRRTVAVSGRGFLSVF